MRRTICCRRARRTHSFNMASLLQDRLAEEVRKRKHLYDPTSRDYRDSELAMYAWREIATTLGKSDAFCRKTWRNMRDRFVKAKKMMQEKKGFGRKLRVVPSILEDLAWLSEFTKHRETDSPEDDEDGYAEVHKAPPSSRTLDNPKPVSSPYPDLPLTSLHLLVPPLRLMSACMWQVAQERTVEHYDKLAEFITQVTEMVPELLHYKQRSQLILGLRARLILELLQKMEKVESDAITDHLNSFQETLTMHEEDEDGEVELSKSAFVDLIQTLVRDQSEKDKYFKEVFSVQYGARFDTSLQILVWEFFYRLEEFLPVPSFSQVFSMFDISSFEYKFEQFLTDPENLKRILQHQRERQTLTKSEFTFMSDAVLSTLASKQAPEYHPNKMSEQKTAEQQDVFSVEVHCDSDEETDNSSSSQLQEFGLSPLPPSPCFEDGADDDAETAAADAAFQPPRCSTEEVKEHLDQSGDKEPTEESMNCRSLGGGSAEVDENSRGAGESTDLERDKTEVDAQPFKCTQCTKSYKHIRELNKHMRVHSKGHLPCIYCNFCKKQFSSQYCLHIHLRQHSGERPYACSHCDRKFMTSTILKSHERTHTGERPYACTMCDKRFNQSYQRTVHLRVHKNEKPYLCSACGLGFPSSGALLVHSRSHTGERPYQCDFCGKRFATSQRRRVHRRFHTGERPYACSLCDKSFSRNSELKKHVRTHTGEKPYKCLTCHKMFSLQSNMKIHLRVHKKS